MAGRARRRDPGESKIQPCLLPCQISWRSRPLSQFPGWSGPQFPCLGSSPKGLSGAQGGPNGPEQPELGVLETFCCSLEPWEAMMGNKLLC